jgi:hypothetical protein
MNNKEFKDLLSRYQLDLCNEKEIAVIESWYNQLDLKTNELTNEQINGILSMTPYVSKKDKKNN